jgi:predicted Zn-dependent protease
MPTATETATCPNCGSLLVLAGSTCPRCGPRAPISPPTVTSISFLALIALALLLFAVVATVVLFTYLNISLAQSDVYKSALQTALASEEVKNALGSNLRAKTPVLGYQFPFAGSEFAEWSVSLVGSRRSGHLYAVANQINGAWDFSRLAVASDDGKDKIDLTTVHRLRLPPVPAKNVYLVSVGLAEDDSILWAPAFYKAKLGIDVKLLPAIDLDPKFMDSERKQLNSDKCVEFLAAKYPDLARDPATILVTITSADMYISDLGWSYAENMRRDGRYAVISSARLHPFMLLGRWNPEWLTSRLQKLVTKNLLMLYFDLPMSLDYTSALSGGVLSGYEIDQMGGEIIGAEGKWDSFVNSGGPSVSYL